MNSSLTMGVGIGLVLLPAIEVLKTTPFIGNYVILLTVISGVVLIVMGAMKK